MARENIGARKPGIFAHVFAYPPAAHKRQMTLPLKLAQTFRRRLVFWCAGGLGRTREESRVASAPPTSLYDAPYPLPCSEQLAEATQCHSVAPTAVRAAPPTIQVRERETRVETSCERCLNSPAPKRHRAAAPMSMPEHEMSLRTESCDQPRRSSSASKAPHARSVTCADQTTNKSRRSEE